MRAVPWPWLRGRRLSLKSDPHRAVLEDLALPDRHGLLQAVDGEVARLEGVAPMGGGHGDHDTRLADRKPPDAVDQRHLLDLGPPLVDGLADLLQLRLGHGSVRL